MNNNTQLYSRLLVFGLLFLSGVASAQNSTGTKSKPTSINQSASKTSSNRISTFISESMTIEQIDEEITKIDSEIKVVKADPVKNQKAINNNWYVLMNDRRTKLVDRKSQLKSNH